MKNARYGTPVFDEEHKDSSAEGTKIELNFAKHFNVGIPRYVLKEIMIAAKLGGLRNFVMNVYLSEPEE